MAAKTFLTLQDYAALDEPPGARYELCDGELIVTPSSSPLHNRIRDRLSARLHTFPGIDALGDVFSETDVKLLGAVVRRPDIIFIRAGRLAGVDLDQVPLSVAPDLVIEIVSKNDRADDLMLKVSQYLKAAAKSVWLMYPNTGIAYRYTPVRLEPQAYSASAGDKFEESELLPGFSLPLNEILR